VVLILTLCSLEEHADGHGDALSSDPLLSSESQFNPPIDAKGVTDGPLPRDPDGDPDDEDDDGIDGEDAELFDDSEDIFASSPREDDPSRLVGKFNNFHARANRLSLVDFKNNASQSDLMSLSRRLTRHDSKDDELEEPPQDSVIVELDAAQVETMR
jgi:hypothetical protein